MAKRLIKGLRILEQDLIDVAKAGKLNVWNKEPICEFEG